MIGRRGGLGSRERAVDRVSDWWERAVVERREGALARLADGWQRTVLEPRDRALAGLAEGWERTVRHPWERALERVADGWELVVLGSRDRAVQLLSDRWEHTVRRLRKRADDDVAGGRAGGVSVWVAALLLVTAAGAGIALAAETGQVAEPPSAILSARPEVGPDPFAARLPAVVRVLASERSDALRRLRARRTAGGQASAAETVAAAYHASVSKLSASAAPPDAARATMLRALRRAAAAYETLARAAEARDARAFSAARDGIERAERTVRQAMRRVTAGQS